MIIRRLPSDFVVVEELEEAWASRVSPSPQSVGDVTVYMLEKESQTTPEAAQALGAALGIGGGKVAYAGLKDKHAVTRQHVTVPLRALAAEPAPRALGGRGWRAEWIGWAPQAINAAAIARNRFEITVRDMTIADAREMERRAGLLSVGPGGVLQVVNYFGDQRFGSARHGKGFAGARLIAGDFEGALRLLIGTPARKDSGKRRTLTRAAAGSWGKWTDVLARTPRCPERRAVEVLAAGGGYKAAFAALPNLVQVMAVEAYQSWLWNAAARRMVDGLGLPDDRLLRADDEFGEMVFPAPASVPGSWAGAEAPMPAADMPLGGDWADATRSVLDSEGLRIEDLRVPGLRRPAFAAATRSLVVRAEPFAMSPAEPDELGRGGRLKRVLRFALPRGAYATTVLRAVGQ